MFGSISAEEGAKKGGELKELVARIGKNNSEGVNIRQKEMSGSVPPGWRSCAKRLTPRENRGPEKRENKQKSE